MSSVDRSNDSDSEKTVEQSIGQADSNGIDPKTETAERDAAAPASKAEFDEGLIDAAEQALGFPQAALDRLDNTPEEKKMMMMIREDPRFAGLRAAVAARQAVNKPTDRLSSVAEVLGVDALQHLDAESMGRLSACSRAFGKPEPARRFSLCALAAWSRLRADKAFRRPQDGKMPNADNVQAWGSDGFRGWLYVLRDWERAVTFERQGGFAAFSFVRRGGAGQYTEDSDDDSYHGPTVDELNKGALSYRRVKFALGHFEVTSDDILSWGKR